MSWTFYVILIIFGLFILLAILNPNFSCFGKMIKSPFYPMLRKKKRKAKEAEDYGFYLVDDGKKENQHREREKKTSKREAQLERDKPKERGVGKEENEVHSGFEIDSD